VLRLVVVQGMKLALAGVAVGAVGALALVRVLRSLLYEVSFEDPVTFVAVSLVALLVAVVACYLPAGVRRARIPWRHCDVNKAPALRHQSYWTPTVKTAEVCGLPPPDRDTWPTR
jgi:hypothetical protein